MSRICGIYKIQNTINHKVYIGQSRDIFGRWKHHVWELNNKKHSNNYLQSAWDKYGKDNFHFEILEECNELDIDFKEQFYIEKYSSLRDCGGYNLNTGGNANKRHSEYVKRKISIAHKGKNKSKESIEKMRKSRIGKHCGKEHWAYGKPMLLETRLKLSNSLKGKMARHKHWSATKVICLNNQEIFDCIEDAAEKCNTLPQNISKCCKGKRLSSGRGQDGVPLQWAYYINGEKQELEEYKPNRYLKNVMQFDKNMNLIAIYESAREADRVLGISYKNISRYCKGERNHKDFVFQFKVVR